MPMRCLINFGFRHPGFVRHRVHVLLSVRKKERKIDFGIRFSGLTENSSVRWTSLW